MLIMQSLPRFISDELLFALQNSPVVFLNGPRQAGKSTLVQTLAQTAHPATYVTLDNAMQVAVATDSPESFLRQFKGPAIIDEIQMAPELFRVLKITVDGLRLSNKQQSNGKFLLTGSANIMALPKLSNPLVGRMSVKTLYPFAACEVFKGKGDFIQRLFQADFAPITKDITLPNAIGTATFPEISGKEMRAYSEWFDGYLTTILQRDVKLLAELEKIGRLPTMLRVLAARAGKLMNDADIARDVGLNSVTSKNYRVILQTMFLCFDLQPWYRNINKRLVKSSKGYLLDTLLLCHLLDWNIDDLKARKPELYGHVIENFVATELLKLLSFSTIRANLLHFRTSDNKEVDFILERPDGSLAGIEVKSASRVNAKDFSGLKLLQEVANNDFVCGIVLYDGNDIVPFGPDLYAVPLAALWQ